MLEDGDLDAAVEAGLIDHNLRAWLEAFAAERRRAPEPLRRHPSAHVLRALRPPRARQV
jgi:hypothetical protein